MKIELDAAKLKWNIKPKELIKNFFDFNWGTTLTEIVEVEKDVEGLAFLLLFQTARKTIVELLQKYGQEKLNNNYHLVSDSLIFENKLKLFFEKEITLDKNFFTDILEYSPKYLTDSFIIFKDYAKVLDIELPEVINNIYYLSYAENLEYEFQEKKEKYIKLLEYFDNPMSIAKIKYGYLFEYYHSIKSFYTNKLQQNVEESRETLRDLYIEPNFLIFKNNLKKTNNNNDKFIKAKIGIHTFINDYYFKNINYFELDKEYNLLFLLGQPGQGKTSFCYKTIYDYLDSNFGLPKIPLFFVKIRDLVAKDFINRPFEILTSHFHDHINFKNDEAFLILDGLDEAYMSGGITDIDLRNLYDRLNKWKWTNPKIKMILTSRENYLNLNDACLDDSLVCKLDVFSDKQVLEYKDRYLSFYPENSFIGKLDIFIDNANKRNYNHLNELVRQPVILYFIALSNIDVDKSNSRSEIYNKIFNSLAERSWDKQKGQLDFIKKSIRADVYQRHLREYIRNIAFSIYQSSNLYITLKDLINLDATKNFISKCFEDEFSKDSKNFMDLTKYLLISFYFQESNKTTDETAIEFFHNSIWEYLTAEYLWEKFKDLFLFKDRNDEFISVEINDYFEFLNTMIGNKSFGGMVRLNLQDIIFNENIEELSLLVNRSKKIFYKLSDNDFLLKYNRDNCDLTAIEKINSIFNLSTTYLGCSCRKIGKIFIFDRKLTDYFFEKMPKGIIHLNDDDYNYISLSTLDKEFHLTSSQLNYVIFNDSISNITFAGCKFNNVLFEYCYLDTFFHDINFDKVIFKTVIMYKSDLLAEKCNFKECSFIDVEFKTKADYENFIKKNTFESSFKPVIAKKDKHYILNFKSEKYDDIYKDITSRILEF